MAQFRCRDFFRPTHCCWQNDSRVFADDGATSKRYQRQLLASMTAVTGDMHVERAAQRA